VRVEWEAGVAEVSAQLTSDELARAQDELGRALGRARVGEDRALANQVRELGERLAHLLAGLLRMTRMHSSDNTAFNKPVEDLSVCLGQLSELLGSVHLVAVEDQVYVNEVRIRAGDKASAIRELSAELQHHNVGGITFHHALGGPAIRALVAALGAPPASSEPRNTLTRALAAAGVSGIELMGRFRFRMAGEAVQERPDPRQLLERALVATDEAFQNLAAGRLPNPLPLRRLVAELLERGLGMEELWQEPPQAPAFARHQLRVARLALLLGNAVSLPPSVLQDLGVAALYHDCGYAAETAAATGAAVSFERHPQAGACLLLEQKGFHEGKVRRVLTALQHHRDADSKPRPSLFARIVRIAEDYDTLVLRGKGTVPTYALAAMLKWSGTRYDAALLQLFVNALGAYPPGTLLRLQDGRVVRSAAPALVREAFAHPLARCVRLADGSAAGPELPAVDLREAGPLEIVPPGA
jgi:hypothetical protein